MSAKLVFLSHIHEEKELALLIKSALEDEFGGFVEVFVSSDGTSIPAGFNFLRRIEDGLVDCVAALYLISPASVKRNWINFELGAVWLRNVISLRSSGPEIPTIPVCHSGSAPSTLPSPLNNLNGVTAGDASQLEFAFRGIQRAVGGAGKFRTNFDALASTIRDFEAKNTYGKSLVSAFRALGFTSQTIDQALQHCVANEGEHVTLVVDFVENGNFQQLKALQDGALKDKFSVKLIGAKIQSGPSGTFNGGEVEAGMMASFVLQYRTLLEKI